MTEQNSERDRIVEDDGLLAAQTISDFGQGDEVLLIRRTGWNQMIEVILKYPDCLRELNALEEFEALSMTVTEISPSEEPK